MNYSVIILAAGKGTRTQLEYNKVFYTFNNGEVLIQKSATIFLEDEDCKQVVIVTTPHEEEFVRSLFTSKKVTFTYGGKERQDSVLEGLYAVTQDKVMIHDGARCYLDKDSLLALKVALAHEEACLLMTPVIDTIKQVENGYVINTPLRSTLYAAQTPQCFTTALIIDAHKAGRSNGFIASDDAQLVEKYTKARIKVVDGKHTNKKITLKEDLPQ